MQTLSQTTFGAPAFWRETPRVRIPPLAPFTFAAPIEEVEVKSEAAVEDLGADRFSWYRLPSTRREWNDLARLLADPARGWLSMSEVKRQALELGYDAAVMVPTVRGSDSASLMVPTMEGLVVGLVGGGLVSLVGCDRRSQRNDQGTRRPRTKQAQAKPSIVGTISGVLTVGAAGDPEPVILPTGLAAALPPYAVSAYRACCLDVVNRLAERPDEWHAFNSDASKLFYGRPRLADGRRPWVWPQVQRDLCAAGIIEAWSSATSDASYQPGACSKSFRLGRRWRAVEGLEVIARTAAEVLPSPAAPAPAREDGSVVEVGSWLERCVLAVEVDLLGALRAIFERYGVTEPATLDLASVLAAISTSTAPASLLASLEEEREKGDSRSAQSIARAQAAARVRHLWAWRVLGKVGLHRDPAGHRLHTPITRLASELRPFLTFNGERLVALDAKNSQMCLLARAALKATNNAADAVDFFEVCGRGAFYEQSYHAVHGRYPTPEERRQWKRRVMGIWLYATAGCMSHDADALALAKRWPNVHVWMWARKQGGVRELPCAMQREEAAIWIDQLGPELERLGCMGLTAHDSVMVPASREAEVRAVLERLYDAAGVRATFS